MNTLTPSSMNATHPIMNHTDATDLLQSSPAYELHHKQIIQDALDALNASNVPGDHQDVIRSQMFA